jgi:hypothetical protein
MAEHPSPIPNVADGSKCEELSASKSGPVHPTKPTSMRRGRHSLMGQFRTCCRLRKLHDVPELGRIGSTHSIYQEQQRARRSKLACERCINQREESSEPSVTQCGSDTEKFAAHIILGFAAHGAGKSAAALRKELGPCERLAPGHNLPNRRHALTRRLHHLYTGRLRWRPR